ncbi:hypothetical protein [Syntrophomonas erecta]
MRKILRKIDQGAELLPDEYENLLNYIENLRANSPESYALFYDRYVRILYTEYATFLPHLAAGISELIEYLVHNPQGWELLQNKYPDLSRFPLALQDYLQYIILNNPGLISTLQDLFIKKDGKLDVLPVQRSGEIVFKFEDGNPYKEFGLKYHFERLARFPFVSRLQTYRYLTRNKASQDRIELIRPGLLGGIFTNKFKSIYYYIFLTEDDPLKSSNACRILNIALYEKTD